jgi:hypothetical protein
MAITEKLDYLAEARRRLPQQFKDKPRIDALLVAFITEVQQIESSLWDVFFGRLLQFGTSGGDMLDKIGRLVGQLRDGFGDAQYLQFIEARIKTNRSNGRLEELLEILGLLYDPNSYQVRQYQPAAIEFELVEASTLNDNYVNKNFLQQAIGAGVSLHFISHDEPLATTLIFDWTVPFTLVGQQPGSSTGTTGGLTAALYGGF